MKVLYRLFGLLLVASGLSEQLYAAQNCVFIGTEALNFYKNSVGDETIKNYLDPNDIVTVLQKDSGRFYVSWAEKPAVAGWMDSRFFAGDCSITVPPAPSVNIPAYVASHALPVITLEFDAKTNPFAENGAYYGTMGSKAAPSGIGNCPHSANYFNDALFANAQFAYYKNRQPILARKVVMTISGGCSRVNALKGMTLEVAKGEKKFENISSYLFPHRSAQTKYESVYLRAGGNDFTRSLFRDGLLHSVLLEKSNEFPWLKEVELQDFQPSVLYVNGRYWGVINIREKLNKGYVNGRYNLKKADVTLAEISYGRTEIKAASNPPAKMLSSQNTNYESARGYAAIEAYVANDDWLGNNIRLWIGSAQGSTWRFILNDLDLSFGYSGEAWKREYPKYLQENLPKYFRGEESWIDPNAHTIIGMMKSAICADQNNFLSKINDLRGIFSSGAIENKARYFEGLYQSELARHIDLWKGPHNSPVGNILGSPVIWSVDSVGSWKDHINKLISFSQARQNVIGSQAQDFVRLIGCP